MPAELGGFRKESFCPSFNFGIVLYPGTNGDHDLDYLMREVYHQRADVLLTTTKPDLSPYDLIFLPGGFAHGDALRAGAIASVDHVTDQVKKLAKRGVPVMGICNGFQVLTESHLLPGALMRNNTLSFQSRSVYVRVENNDTIFTNQCQNGQVLRLPIAHGEGNYYCGDGVLKSLKRNNQVVFRYCTEEGEVCPEANPNGSIDNIAGIINKAGNVLGMMPHPERASEEIIWKGADGKFIMTSLIHGLAQGHD